LGIGIAEDRDGLERDARPAGNPAAVADAGGERRKVLKQDAALMRRDRSAVGDAASRAAGAEDVNVRHEDALLSFRGDRAAIRAAPGEGRDHLDLDAAGARGNPAATAIDDAAGKDRGVFHENANAGVGKNADRGDRAAIGNAAREARYGSDPRGSRAAHEDAVTRFPSDCAALAVDDSTGEAFYETNANSAKRAGNFAAVDDSAAATRATHKDG